MGGVTIKGCKNTSATKVVIPDTIGGKPVVEIAYRAFFNNSIKEVHLPDTVHTIGRESFKYCIKLQSIHLPEGLLEIGPEAFTFCESLESIEFPDGLLKIGNWAFGSTGLQGEVVIPDSVESIGSSLFSSCSGIKSLVIGKGIKELYGGYDQFAQNESILQKGFIKNITFRSESVPTLKYTGSLCGNEKVIGLFNFQSLETIFVPAESYEQYVDAFQSKIRSTTKIVAFEEDKFTERVAVISPEHQASGVVVNDQNPLTLRFSVKGASGYDNTVGNVKIYSYIDDELIYDSSKNGGSIEFIDGSSVGSDGIRVLDHGGQFLLTLPKDICRNFSHTTTYYIVINDYFAINADGKNIPLHMEKDDWYFTIFVNALSNRWEILAPLHHSSGVVINEDHPLVLRFFVENGQSFDNEAGSVKIYNTADDLVYDSSKDGGDIRSRSNDFTGSTFSIILPKDISSKFTHNTVYYAIIDDQFILDANGNNIPLGMTSDDWSFTTSIQDKFKPVVRQELKDGTVIDAPYNYEFFYDDAYFADSSYTYNLALNTWAFSLAVAAYECADNENYTKGYKNSEAYLRDLGFTQGFEANYSFKEQPGTDSIGVCAGHKELWIDGIKYTLIAMPIRGGGYEKEWSSNFLVGDGSVHHRGFENAAKEVVEFLEDYITSYNIEGQVKIVVAGYSRAAATTNIVTSYIDDGVLSDKNEKIIIDRNGVFGFGFETPRMVKDSKRINDKKYNNIYNIINPIDIVPKVVFQDWGFEHYGIVNILPTAISGNSFDYLYSQFISNYEEITGDEYPSQTFVWHKQFGFSEKHLFKKGVVAQALYERKLLKKLANILISPNVYVTLYQREMRNIVGQTLGGKDSSGINIWDFILMLCDIPIIAAALLFDNDDDLLTIINNKDLLAQGHYPEICLTWLATLNEVPAGELENMFAYTKYRLVNIACPVNVSVYDSGGNLLTQIIDDVTVDSEDSNILAYVDENGQKIIALPGDEEYNVIVEATGEGEVNYSVTECDFAGATDERRINYFDIPIQKGDILTGDIENLEENEGVYKLYKDNKELKISEIVNAPEYFSIDLGIEGNGTIRGDRVVMEGDFVTLTAEAEDGCILDGWYQNGEKICDDTEYRFRVMENKKFNVKFIAIPTITPTPDEPMATPTTTPTSAATPVPAVTPTVVPGTVPTMIPTVTPVPSPEASVTPGAGATATPAATPVSAVTPTVVPGTVPTVIPTVTPEPSVEASVTPGAGATATPAATPVPEVTPTAVPGTVPTMVPTVIPEPSAEASVTPGAGATATPAATPVPEAIPTAVPVAVPTPIPAVTPEPLPEASVTPAAPPPMVSPEPGAISQDVPTEIPTPTVESNLAAMPDSEPSAMPLPAEDSSADRDEASSPASSNGDGSSSVYVPFRTRQSSGSSGGSGGYTNTSFASSSLNSILGWATDRQDTPGSWHQSNDEEWYYLRRGGGKWIGWIISGHQWYYLDPENGKMLTGWQFIDGKWYFFNLHSSGNNPLGRMFFHEKTFDGYYVQEDGSWDGKERN